MYGMQSTQAGGSCWLLAGVTNTSRKDREQKTVPRRLRNIMRFLCIVVVYGLW